MQNNEGKIKDDNKESYEGVKSEVKIEIHGHFSTNFDLEIVLRVINKCKSIETKNTLLKIDFTYVESVNAGALALLLSVISDLHALGVVVQCEMPQHATSKSEIIETGFLEHFINHLGEKTPGKNKIFVKGKGSTDQQRIAKEIRAAMRTVYGIESFNQPMQGAVVEMMANSVNHAYKNSAKKSNYYINEISKQKRWYLSVVHIYAERKVYFTFVDNGVGLLNTLRRGIFSRFTEILDDKSVIQKAFEGHYRSSSLLNERGQGLPTIALAIEKGALRNLKVVTNDCMFTFDDQDLIKLKDFFEGTAYFWTLDAICAYGNT